LPAAQIDRRYRTGPSNFLSLSAHDVFSCTFSILINIVNPRNSEEAIPVTSPDATIGPSGKKSTFPGHAGFGTAK
jgi:hypothetical protein